MTPCTSCCRASPGTDYSSIERDAICSECRTGDVIEIPSLLPDIHHKLTCRGF